MNKILIYDFEVFKCDVLLGVVAIDGDRKKLYQTWNKNDIRDLYYRVKNTDWVWVGHNNQGYDDFIFEAIVKGYDPYETSKEIIERHRGYCWFDIVSYDIMKASNKFLSLKLTELIRGKNIHTTDVDFDLDRPLTEDEKRMIEKYNEDDLEATLYNFEKFYNKFALRLDLIDEFGLDKREALKATEGQLSAMVLGAKRIPDIETKLITPPVYENLRLENKQLLDFYYSETFRYRKSKVIHIGNADLHIGSGGLHQAIQRCHYDKLLYCDVSGYYNLVMMNYNLLPRSVPDEGKYRYRDMYRQQLTMKKTNPIKREGYKTVLLSVFGAQINEHSDFYDPQQGYLVTITGQLFLCDLLEKLAPYVTIVQTNTDGIMIVPNDWDMEPYIIGMIEDWERRTKFVIKKEHIYNLWQRDVNNYVYQNEDGSIECKGEALRNWEVSDKAYSRMLLFDSTNPPIIARGVVEYLINHVPPEETVEKYKNDFRMFQYSCKRGTYDRLELNGVLIQSPSRAFASLHNSGEIVKIKQDKSSRIPNLPSQVFVFNDDLSTMDSSDLDYHHYIMRIKERIDEFTDPVQLSLW